MIDSERTDTERLETPRQLAKRVGLSERQVRHLIQRRQLEHVPVGGRILIPVGAFLRFLEANKVQPCQGEIRGRDFVGSTSANVTTSPGQNTAAAASARLARQIANELKSSSPNGCTEEGAELAQVIPLKSS
jgi:excisionase family DNA binding protein